MNTSDSFLDSPSQPTLHGSLSLGETVTGTLADATGRYHAWEFAVDTPLWVTFRVTPDTADPLSGGALALYRAHPGGFDQSFVSLPVGSGSAWEGRLPRGRYRVVVYGAQPTSTGKFSLAAEPAPSDETRCDASAAETGGGDGSMTRPFLLCSRAQLETLRKGVPLANRWFVLAADLDLGGAPHTPLVDFYGNLDGNAHTISNVTVTGGGFIEDNYGTVERLRFTNTSITSTNSAGGVVARNWGLLLDLDVAGTVHGGRWVGGVAGLSMSSARMQGIHFSGTVAGNDRVGGVVGSAGGSLFGLSSAGHVSAATEAAGGIVGVAESGALVRLANSSALVEADLMAGGIAGAVDHGTIELSTSTGTVVGHQALAGAIAGKLISGEIRTSTASGEVASMQQVGGLVGMIVSASVTDCISSARVSGGSEAAALIGGSAGGGVNASARLVGLGAVTSSSGRNLSCSGAGGGSVLCDATATGLPTTTVLVHPHSDFLLPSTFADFGGTLWDLGPLPSTGIPALRWTGDATLRVLGEPSRNVVQVFELDWTMYAAEEIGIRFGEETTEYTFPVRDAAIPGYALTIGGVPMPEGSAFDYRYARDDFDERECTNNWPDEVSWTIRTARAPFAEYGGHSLQDVMSGGSGQRGHSSWESALNSTLCRCSPRNANHPMCLGQSR